MADPFDELRTEILQDVIEQYPLGTLTAQLQGRLEAFHLPFYLRPEQGEFGTLYAHVARHNPLWRDISAQQEAMVVFHAGDAYISPGWYPSKQQHHRQVPSWNYRRVHARGRVIIHDDPRYLMRLLAQLTRKHEASQALPWKMADAPKEYIDALMQAIVGIEIPISELSGKFKLSQNKSQQDIAGAADNLRQQGNSAMAEAMLAACAKGLT